MTSVFILLLTSSTAFSQVLQFTAIPDQNTTRLQQRFSKVAIYLSEQLGIDTEYIPVKFYSAAVAAFKNNQVQLAWLGGLSGVQARRSVTGAQAIAQGEEDRKFVSYFIANTKTGLKTAPNFPDEINGHTFIFGSKGSTSGRLMPEYFIREHFDHIAPRKIFRRVGFSGDHSKTIALVQSGSYEIGVVNYKVWQQELTQGLIDTNKIRVIWQTPPYPDYNWSIRPDVEKKFGKGFIGKVQKVLLDMTDKKILASFSRTRFIVADNSMYEPVLKTAITVGIIEK